MTNAVVQPVCVDFEIILNGKKYKLNLYPEMCREDDGLEFTGCYEGSLVSGKTVQAFCVEPKNRGGKTATEKWEIFPENTDEALIEILDKLIVAFLKGDNYKVSLN